MSDGTERRALPPQAGELVVGVLTDGWRSAVADQLATIASDAFWKKTKRRRGRGFDCAALADLAEALEAAKAWAHDTVGALARRGFTRFGRPEAEQHLAEQLAKRIPLPGDDEIDQVVVHLRVVGVYVCYAAGADALARCRCLRALARDRTKEELKRELEAKLDEAFPVASSWDAARLREGRRSLTPRGSMARRDSEARVRPGVPG